MSLTHCNQCNSELTTVRINLSIIFTANDPHPENIVLCSKGCAIAFIQALRD